MVPVVLGCLVYINSLSGCFVWDDSGLIVGTQELRDHDAPVQSVFVKPNFAAPYYRPLLWVSFFWDHYLWGQNPMGYHLTNVVVHGITIGLVSWLVVNLGLSGGVAFFTAGLFATHPVQTEAISWIAGRNDPLMVLFLLLSLNGLLVGRKTKRFTFKIIYYSIAVVAFLCALLTKEIAIIGVPLLMLIDVFYQTKAWKGTQRKELLALYASFILMSCCFFALRSFALSSLPSQLSGNLENLLKVLSTPLKVYAYYCKVLLFPVNLTVGPSLYNPAPSSIFLVFVIVFSSITSAVVLVPKIRREILFGMLWILVYLLPVSGLVWMSVPVLEHRLYGASIGFCLMVAAVGCNGFPLYKAFAKDAAGYVVLTALILLYGSLTIDRNRIWKDDITIWSDTLKKSPDSLTALNNLANALIQKNQLDQGIAYLQTALKVHPQAEKLYGNLGLAFYYKKDYRQAINAYEKALNINPRSAETYNYLALAHKGNGNKEAALTNFNKSLALKPQFLPAYLNRADLYRECGDKIRALADYQHALHLSPQSSAVHTALGFFYEQEGAVDKALSHYQQAVTFDPTNYQALNNISQLYSRQGAFDNARTYLAKALKIKPDAPELHLNLGLIYFNTGKIDQAIESYRKALSINPAYIDAHFNIATAYLFTPHGAENARYHFNRVLELNPDYPHSEAVKKALASLETRGTMK